MIRMSKRELLTLVGQTFDQRFSGSIKAGFLALAAIGLMFTALSSEAAAQETNPPAAPGIAKISGPGSIPGSIEDTRYRIGPGDVLTIIVRKAAELSGPVRVDQRGMIRIPMITGDVQAVCHTESELASMIRTLYLEYKKDPNVEVFVTEFQSRPVAVIGAINSPGQYRLQRQVRLNELISFSGGPATRAGRTIQIVHSSAPNLCVSPTEKATNDSDQISVYVLNDTMVGKAEANPFVQPGDIIQVPEADQVFIIGHVVQPKAIALGDKPITISRAMAMVGGPSRDGKTSGIKIIRQMPDGSGKREIYVNLKDIEKQKTPDIALMANDVVEVPASVGKTILNMFAGAVGPTISGTAVRGIGP